MHPQVVKFEEEMIMSSSFDDIAEYLFKVIQLEALFRWVSPRNSTCLWEPAKWLNRLEKYLAFNGAKTFSIL